MYHFRRRGSTRLTGSSLDLPLPRISLVRGSPFSEPPFFALVATKGKTPPLHFPIILAQKKMADMMTEIGLGLQGCLRVGRLRDEMGYIAPGYGNT